MGDRTECTEVLLVSPTPGRVRLGQFLVQRAVSAGTAVQGGVMVLGWCRTMGTWQWGRVGMAGLGSNLNGSYFALKKTWCTLESKLKSRMGQAEVEG